jgi:hypothetical protein
MLTYNVEVEIVSRGETSKVPAVAKKSEDSTPEGGSITDNAGKLDISFKDAENQMIVLRLPRRDLADILKMVDGVQI